MSEELEAYFKSMMWYGRMTFRLKTKDPEIGRAETRAALLLVHALGNVEVNGRPALDAWRVPRARDTRTGDVVHPRLAYLVDAEGTIAYAITGGVDQMMALLDRL